LDRVTPKGHYTLIERKKKNLKKAKLNKETFQGDLSVMGGHYFSSSDIK
tara:strand:- start:389 stop:535 length:147 start_codon:yes stop_codon:yes gene_type:complete